MLLKLGKDAPPEKGTCSTCVHFKPHIIHSHAGRPIPLWYGLCAILPLTCCEQTHACPLWHKK